MAEAEAVVAEKDGPVRADELLANERDQVRADRGPCRGGKQLGNGAAMEQPPLDRSPLNHGALGGLEPVEASREQRLDRRRDDQLAVAALARASPASARRRADFPRRPRRSARACRVEPLAELVDRELSTPRPRSGSRRTSVAFGRAVAHAGRLSSRSGRARQSSRSGAPARSSATCSSRSSKRRLGPVDVVDDRDQRPVARERLEQLARRPRRSLPASAPPAERDRADDAVGDRASSTPATSASVAWSSAADLADDLAERPVGDALAVRKAAPDDDRRVAPRRRRGTRATSRDLPIPAAPTTVHELRHSLAPRLARMRLAEPASSRDAADERRVDPRARTRARPASTSSRRNAATGSALPFSSSGATASTSTARGRAACVSPPIRISPGCGRLLQPRGDVDRVAGDERLAASPATTSPVLMPIRARDSSAELASAADSRISTAARTARSASSSCTRGMPNTAIDRVADELLDRAAVALEDRAQLCVSSSPSARAAPRDRCARRAPSSRRGRRTGR